MAFWPGGWRWLDWSRSFPLRVPFSVRKMLVCGKRRWPIRVGCDMRFPPSLSVNNFVRVTDDAYASAGFVTQRFPSFGMDVSVIGPWLSASFDNPAIQTGAPIMRLTLVGNPPQRIRTVLEDTRGSVLTLADGAGGQKWEVVSKLEWVPDGETQPTWVFVFARPFVAGPLVSSPFCPGSATAPLDTTFVMRADPATEGHASISTLAPGDYTISYSIIPSAPGTPGFTAYQGSCVVVGFIGTPPLSGTFTVTVSAGNTLRLFFASSLVPAICYVRVTPP